MTNNLLTQYNYNKGRVILSTPFAYQSFKQNVTTKQCMDCEMPADYVETPYVKVGDIAILDFKGFTVGSCSEIEEMVLGCVSVQDFCEDLQLAVNDESINQVVVNFDSGGGYGQYLVETAELIQELKQIKPIHAYTSGYMCSAAYRVACNCSNVIVSPSSVIGSVGVYVEYEDDTKALDMAGIKVKTFQGGSQKTIGSPYISLTHEQETAIQADIDKEWLAFKECVKSNRGAVKEDFLQGQSFTGTESMELNTNLADGIVNSLSQFIELISITNN